MPKKMKPSEPHPDDLMAVTIGLQFQAKLNPESSDPPEFHTTAFRYTLPAAEAADYLEKVVSAIRDRRLYGFMVQEAAEDHVGAGEWIKKTAADIFAEAGVEQAKENLKAESPNVLDLRRDD